MSSRDPHLPPPLPRAPGAALPALAGASRWRTWILIVVGVGLALTLVVTLVGAVGYSFVREFGGASMAPEISAEALRAEAHDAFQSAVDGDGPIAPFDPADPERKSILALISQLETVSQEHNVPGHLALWDLDRFLLRVDAATGTRPNALERFLRIEQLKESLEPEPDLGRLILVRVEYDPEHPDLRTVYALGKDRSDPESAEAWRLWIAKSGRGWKLYEAQRLDSDLPESGRHLGMSGDSAASRRTERAYEKINAADSAIDGQEKRRLLREAESGDVLPWHVNHRWHLLGSHWLLLGERVEAERCFRQIKDPAAAPGALLGLARCLQYSNPEQALKCVAEYEAVVATTPLAAGLKAQLHAAAGRKDLAAAAWKQALRLDAGRIEALQGCLRAAPPQNVEEVASLLDATEDPIATASSLMQGLYYRAPDAVLLQLIEFVRRREPDSPRLFVMQARFKEQRDEEGIPELYLAASRRSAEPEKQQYYRSYLSRMLEDGRAQEAYEVADNPRKAFETLFDNSLYNDDDYDDYDETDSVNPQSKLPDALLELHRQRFPEDPSLLLALTRRAIAGGQFAEAEKLARRGLAGASSSPRKSELEEQLTLALFHDGRALDGLDYNLPPEERVSRFRALGRLAASHHQWDTLQQLVERGRVMLPRDGHLPFFAAQIAAHERRWDEAIDAFQSLRRDSELRWQAEHAYLEAVFDAGQAARRFKRTSNQEREFQRWAMPLLARGDWKQYEALAAAFREKNGDLPALREHDGEMALARGDYEAAAAYFAKLLGDGREDVADDWRARRFAGEYLLALERLGRLSEARQRAVEWSENQNTLLKHRFILAEFFAAAGDLSRAQELYERDTRTTENVYGPSTEGEFSGYHSDISGHLWLSPAHHELHARRPVTLYWNHSKPVATLLYGAAPTLNREKLLQALRAAGVEGQVESWPPAAAAADAPSNDRRRGAVFVVRLPEATIVLAHNDPAAVADSGYTQYVDPRDGGDWFRVVAEPRSRISIGVIGWNGATTRTAEAAARRLALAFADESTVVLNADSQRAARSPSALRAVDWTRTGLMPHDATVRVRYRITPPKKADESATPEAAPTEEARRDSVVQRRKFNQTLRAATTDKSPADLRVMVYSTHGAAVEPLWIRVSALEPHGSSSRWIGRLESASQLVPQLHEGLRVSVDEQLIQALQSGGGEIQRRAVEP